MNDTFVRDLDEILSSYDDLVLALKTKFPKTDLRLLFEMMSHHFLHPEHVPSLQIEIFYGDGVDLNGKASALAKRVDRVPAVYGSERRLVVEPRLS